MCYTILNASCINVVVLLFNEHRFPYANLFSIGPNFVKDLNLYFSLSLTLTPPQNSPTSSTITLESSITSFNTIVF